jgi:O-acetylserine/cysteine efflux transporter
VLIAARSGGETTLLGLGLTLFAAFNWACANVIGRRAQDVNALAYIVWASAFAVPPLLALTLIVDGPSEIRAGVEAAGAGTWLAVAYQSAGNTMFGYGAWGWLLSRHEAATITPTALLVPVFGMAAAAIFLDEALPAWKLIAAALVMAGLSLNLVIPRLSNLRAADSPVAQTEPSEASL